MENASTAKQLLQTLLDKMGFEHQVIDQESPEPSEELHFSIQTPLPSILIGKGAECLDDLQYLLNRILKHHIPDSPRIKIDCNNYRKDREASLLERSRNIANQVLLDGKTRKLPPLNAYYRRLIHQELRNIKGIKTSSPSKPSRFKRILISKLS